MVTNAAVMPLSAKPWRNLRWLVLAPHPDDETLGAGALISQAARNGRLAGVVYLTDGSGSHPSRKVGATPLISVRKREAANALFRLTGSRRYKPVNLGWGDAQPAERNDPLFSRTIARMKALCAHRQVTAIAVTALDEPHCDHAAAARLAYAVQHVFRGNLIVAEYLVWARAVEQTPHRVLRTQPMPPGKRRHALRAHRSQLTASLGPGFRLTRAQQRMPTSDLLYLRKYQ